MDVIEKLRDMSFWSIEDFDNAGAHIQDHMLPENNITEKIMSTLEDDKKTFSFFINEKAAQDLIHEALLNPLIQKRIQRWACKCKAQTRIVMGYPADKLIGYSYNIQNAGDNFSITHSECYTICIVFLRNPEREDDFIFFTAYPEREMTKLTIL